MNLKDTLREYYSFYGNTDEGLINDTIAIDSITINDELAAELSLLSKLLNNNKSKKDFNYCKCKLEEIATKLSANPCLIEELKLIKNDIELDINGISNGVIWFQQAQETCLPNNNNMQDITKLVNLDINIINSLRMQGSLILQLYIALVYMRCGPVSKILQIGSTKKCQTMDLYKKILYSDYVRHIRNALSHGSFKINIAGVYFNDEGYEIVATQKFLNQICMWLFVLYYQCILFAQRELNEKK